MAARSRMRHGRRGHADAHTCGDPARVLPHLYIGTTLTSRDVNLLRAVGITHLLNAGGTSNWAGSRLGLTLMQRDIADEVDCPLAPHLQPTFDFIEQARASSGACFVCSDRGISRCSAIAAYYLMRCERLSFTDAQAEIAEVRSCCCPNSGFVRELNALSPKFAESGGRSPRGSGLLRSPRGQGARQPLPLLSDAARRARHARSSRNSETQWRVAIDPQQGHVVRVGIGRKGGGQESPRGSSQWRRDAAALTRNREAEKMEQALTEQWAQQDAETERRPRIFASQPGALYRGPLMPRQSPRGLAAGCTIGSNQGCLCQICFLNDTQQRARSARIKAQLDLPAEMQTSSFC